MRHSVRMRATRALASSTRPHTPRTRRSRPSSTAAVGIAQGSTRLRIYQPGAGSTWSQAAAFSEDDLCPGGASTLTGWRCAI